MHLLSQFAPWPSAALLLLATQGLSQSVPNPNLNFDSLGEVTLAGDFDAIAVYSTPGQQQGFTSNGTQSILSTLPSGVFDVLASTDAGISDMCPFVLKDGTLSGLVVGGNFTSIGGVAAQSVALLDTNTLEITPIDGVQGIVSALYCDQDTETVYIGGAFEAQNSSNAIAWKSGSFTNLPFAGFDAPVTAITRAPNGHIVFGGSFTGLGNISSFALTDPQTQVINLGTANVTAVGNTTRQGLGNPRNILCPNNSTDGSTSFLLADNTPGSWRADLAFGFEPTKLRLWNTQQEGRGTKTWRFTALPINGIMNFTYIDPKTGDRAFCDARCPLAPANASQPFQDFLFVNLVGMDSFRIDISDFYGDGGGLDGIELFQNDIFAYAIEAFNDPVCAGEGTQSTATATGPWFSTPSRQSVSDYLSAVVGPTTVDSTSIVFEPDVQQSGNYSIIIYTPGCIQDSSCSARAIVTVNGTLTADGGQTFSSTVFQTNDFDKYDQVYQGFVDVTSSSFRPAITITPSGQQQNQLVVASRVKFGFISSTGGLNGLFDYDPSSEEIDSDFARSAINNAGTTLKPGAHILALTTRDDTIYAAGNFSDEVFENIMSFTDNNATSLADGGLNSAVTSMYSSDDFLYVGGNFTNTNENNVQGLNNAAAYQFSKNTWVPLGAGLDGPVDTVVPMQLNTSEDKVETVIVFSGPFSQIREFGSIPATRAPGLAIWVPSNNGWLETMTIPKQAFAGQLSTAAILPNNTWLGAGTLRSLGLAISGAAGMLSQDGRVNLQQLPITINSNSPSLSSRKRAILDSQNVTGVTSGAYYLENGQNVTIFAGHFSAVATNGSTIDNLMFLNASNNNAVTGAPPAIETESTIMTVVVTSNLLFVGGRISGRLNNMNLAGLVLYDLSTADYRTIQPASLEGDDVVVNTFAPQPGTSALYVGGSFDRTSQGLSCPSVCMYDTATDQWNTVGSGLEGSVSDLFWAGKNLLATGNLTVEGNQTSLALYNVDQQIWTVIDNPAIPGPVSAFCPAAKDENHMWIAGTATNGSTFLIEIDNDNTRPVIDAFGPGTTIHGLQIMKLTQNHGSTDFLDRDRALLVTGQLNITNFGNAAAALFNGTEMQPLILASTSNGEPGSISRVFTSKEDDLTSNSKFTPPLESLIRFFC